MYNNWLYPNSVLWLLLLYGNPAFCGHSCIALARHCHELNSTAACHALLFHKDNMNDGSHLSAICFYRAVLSLLELEMKLCVYEGSIHDPKPGATNKRGQNKLEWILTRIVAVFRLEISQSIPV